MKKNKLFPLMEVSNNCLINPNGDITMAFEIDKAPALTRSAEECVRVTLGITKATAKLHPRLIVHWQDRYYERQYQTPSSEIATDEVQKANDRHFANRAYLDHKAYLCITITGGSQGPPPRVVSTILGNNLVPLTAREETQLRKFKDLVEQVMLILQQAAGIGYRLLTRQELLGGRQTMGLTEPYGLLSPAESKPVVLDIQNEGGLRVGEKHVQILSIDNGSALPSEISPIVRYDDYSTDKTHFAVPTGAYMGALLPYEHIYNLYVIIEDRPNLIKRFDKKQRRHDSLEGRHGANTATQTDLRTYKETLEKGEQQPARMHANVITWSEDQGKLAEIYQRLVANATKIGVNLHLETLNTLRLYAAAIPGNAAELPNKHTFTTFAEQASCFAVTESRPKDCPGPSSISFVDRNTGIPLLVDLYEFPKRKGLINNFNKMVFGPSGSGKSVLVQKLVWSAYLQGHHVMICDYGGSYKRTCQHCNGQYFAFEDGQDLQFNPFLLGEGETLDTEKMESLVALLMILWKTGDQTYTRSEYIAVSDILSQYYAYLHANPPVLACFDSFYRWTRDIYVPQLTDSGLREKDFDWRNFLFVLRPYFQGGEYDQLLNASVNQNLLQERFVVWELDRIKDHPILFPVLVVLLMELYVSKLRKLKGVRKVLVMDEAWKALMTPVTSEFVKWVFKTVRKFNGEAIVATQDIEDLIGNPIVKNAVINNADTKIIMDVRKLMNRFDEFQNALGLTEKDKTLLFSLKPREFFVMHSGGHSRVYGLELPLEELMLYTTDEPQRIKVEEYAQRYGGLWPGIKALTADVRSGAVKWLIVFAVVLGGTLLPNGGAKAQLIDIGEEIIKEALETADLKIQRLQTQTLLLQNAEKSLENTMAGDLLDDITGWVQQQDQLFSEYYGELWQVKAALSGFSKVAQLIDRQAQLVKEYERATAAVRQDTHFSPGEVTQMLNVYSGILNASVHNVGQLSLVIQGSVTQMDDANRLRIIDETAANIDHNYAALQQYNSENTLLSLQRAKDESEIQTIKSLYGIQ